ncbi:MAG: hypothetical protein ABIB71_07255 [Candidatus Woesearchaeota archaeon]
METTKTEQKNTTAYQLKKLLCKKEKQDLGNVERWKQIPVEYIVTANTLGIELNDHALKRLNESEDKDHALEAIYVTQFFTKEAKKLKKHDLANKLEAMVGNEGIATEDIAFYATKAIENELPKETVRKKLAKAYAQEQKAIEKPSTETKDYVDVVIVPTSENDAYVYVSPLPDDLTSASINVYSVNGKQKTLEDSVRKLVSNASVQMGKELDNKIGYWKKEQRTSKIVGLAGLGGVLTFTGLGAVLYAVTGEPGTLAFFGGVLGGVSGFFSFAGLCTYSDQSGEIKKITQKKESFETLLNRINWIQSEDLKEAYNCALSEKGSSPKAYKKKCIEKAVLHVISNSEEIGLKKPFKDAYWKQLEASNKNKFDEFKVKLDDKTNIYGGK